MELHNKYTVPGRDHMSTILQDLFTIDFPSVH